MQHPLQTSGPSLPPQVRPADLKKAILKLRWIGQENEALELQRLLARLAPEECGPFWPLDTD